MRLLDMHKKAAYFIKDVNFIISIGVRLVVYLIEGVLLRRKLMAFHLIAPKINL